jgi:putative ABC transport system ATP-binding protein
VPQQGEVWFNSTPVHTMGALNRERLRRERFGWIGPDPQLVPELTAWENAALPLLLRGSSHRKARAAALEWMERLDIGRCARKRPRALLQSQRQRIALARALADRRAAHRRPGPGAADPHHRRQVPPHHPRARDP